MEDCCYICHDCPNEGIQVSRVSSGPQDTSLEKAFQNEMGSTDIVFRNPLSPCVVGNILSGGTWKQGDGDGAGRGAPPGLVGRRAVHGSREIRRHCFRRCVKEASLSGRAGGGGRGVCRQREGVLFSSSNRRISWSVVASSS